MSREFKFRVYSFVCEEFIYFDIYNYPQGIAGGVSEPQEYTGLKDKNGKEIYEGDILQSTITNTFYQVKHGWYRQYEELELNTGGIHTFNYSHIGFFVEYNENGEACEGTLAIRNSNSVVVGNIFENPELLK